MDMGFAFLDIQDKAHILHLRKSRYVLNSKLARNVQMEGGKAGMEMRVNINHRSQFFTLFKIKLLKPSHYLAFQYSHTLPNNPAVWELQFNTSINFVVYLKTQNSCGLYTTRTVILGTYHFFFLPVLTQWITQLAADSVLVKKQGWLLASKQNYSMLAFFSLFLFPFPFCKKKKKRRPEKTWQIRGSILFFCFKNIIRFFIHSGNNTMLLLLLLQYFSRKAG